MCGTRIKIRFRSNFSRENNRLCVPDGAAGKFDTVRVREPFGIRASDYVFNAVRIDIIINPFACGVFVIADRIENVAGRGRVSSAPFTS